MYQIPESLKSLANAVGLYRGSDNMLRMEADDLTPGIVGTWIDYDEVYQRYLQEFVDDVDGAAWRDYLAPAYLRELLASERGYRHFTMRFRESAQGVRWTEVTLERVEDDLVLITSRRMGQDQSDAAILQAIDPRYDYVARIEVETGGYTLYACSREVRPYLPVSHPDYNQVVSELNDRFVVSAERDELTANMSLGHVRHVLAEEPEYVLYATATEFGSLRYKKLRFCFTGPDRSFILLARIDITDIVRDQRLRSVEDVRKTRYLDDLPSACCVMKILTDDEGVPFDAAYIYLNRAHTELTGAITGDLVTASHREHFPDEAPDWFDLYIDTATTGCPHVLHRYSVKMQRHLLIKTFRPEPGFCGSLVLDVTDQVLMERELERKRARYELEAKQDSLTGLLNVRAGRREIKRLLAGRHPGSYAMMFVFDLDDFKRINDTYGHAAGDRVLVGFARVLDETFRQGDVIYRLGGDEFAVFADGFADPAPAVDALMTRLFAHVDQVRLHEPLGTVSAGVFASRANLGFTTFYERADRVLYRCKRKGKNNYELMLDE